MTAEERRRLTAIAAQRVHAFAKQETDQIAKRITAEIHRQANQLGLDALEIMDAFDSQNAGRLIATAKVEVKAAK